MYFSHSIESIGRRSLRFLSLCLLFTALGPCHSPAFAKATAEIKSPVSEIVNIPFSVGVVDDSIYKQYDCRVLAESLIERKKLFDRRWGTVGSPTTHDFETVVFVREKIIDSILKNGLLNAHQLPKPDKNAVMWRGLLEDYILGIRLAPKSVEGDRNAKANILRPKYGLVVPTETVGVPINPRHQLQHYGDIILVLKPELQKRTTYTFGDSLDSFFAGKMTASSPSCPHPLTEFDPKDYIEDELCLPYIEAQIWGPVTASDIKEIRLPDSNTGLQQKLAGCGIPLRTYNRTALMQQVFPVDASALAVKPLDQAPAADKTPLAETEKGQGTAAEPLPL